MTSILSIQSFVSYGHVGNSAAVFPLMRMGVEVYPVLTVCFSNTTAYGTWRGPVLKASDVTDVVAGLDERGVLGVDGVLTGYQGSAEIASAIMSTVSLVRERNPEAVYCCDPVMGDVGRGFFVTPGLPERIRDEVVPMADIVTPNHFELDFLTGRHSAVVPELVQAARDLIAVGPSVVLVTSAVTEDLGEDAISMVAVTADAAWRVTMPKLAPTFTGSGDITAAIFLASYLERRDVPAALGATADIVHGILRVTDRSGKRELQLVAAQDEIVAPTQRFEVVAL